MSYVECYVAAVPSSNENSYKSHCSKMAEVFKDHGALRTVDGWGKEIPEGKLTSFPMAVKAKDDETVVLGWIEWESKQARDSGMAKAMQDDRLAMEHMPFDGKRLIFAGFEIFSDV